MLLNKLQGTAKRFSCKGTDLAFCDQMIIYRVVCMQ